MYPRSVVAEVLRRRATGSSASRIAADLGIHRSTVRAWLAGRTPHSFLEGTCSVCGATQHDFRRLSATYVYLLGLYLGDGCISTHPRQVFRMRIVLDERYPQIIASATDAINAVCQRSANVLTRSDRCVEVSSYWRSWPCYFPQHGPGKKHERAISLRQWQRELVDRWPEQLLRGLIESDGCRFINTGRGGWSCPRYAFSNRSADIHGFFRAACDHLGVRWTAAGAHTTYVSRKADVALLDTFIGPKR